MEWVLRSPQIHSTFSNLGFAYADGYHVNENCNAALETILHNILTEDKYLRTYRRSISFGQNIKKDLIPLLIYAKEDRTIELLIKILVNLTIPIECLLSLDVISKTDVGRHTIFEVNNLLTAAKVALTDHRATKVVIEFLKKNCDGEQKAKLASEQCTNISNTLLFLRNILHIPEDINNSLSPSYNGSTHNVQNQILWNLFSQSIDKALIKLMTIPDASNWAVTMVQLIALLYKDQHVTTLHKLLNLWLEASLSESSEDNESNTSPPDRGSDDSSPMLTSDPTSDSSDTGGSGKSNDDPKTVNSNWETSPRNINENAKSFRSPRPIDKIQTEMCERQKYIMNASENTMECNDMNCPKEVTERQQFQPANNEKKTVISENSDCGYGTQIENQESISTSSNEDELPTKKPVHQKPQHPKQRINNKTRASTTIQERKRKKIVKRCKANIINVQGLSHNTPTDDDISNVLKEFTVDFLLKGYNSLVQTLHNQILTNLQLEIDTSHFFWLVTYFLKFATQIELDLEHVCSVLSFDIVSYLTAEGVNLCEQFELAIKLDGNDLKPCIRRLHLVVTAIREFVQAIEVYKKSAHLTSNDQKILLKLQMKMCETEELRSLLVLLLRHYNPKYHSKQYLQDLIVTNHILLMFLDSIMKLPEYSGFGNNNMPDHIRQFASPEIMYQYSLLLEDYEGNGEFVNDCIFTIMHHVGGELDSLISLYQPKILKTFSAIWKSDFEICDDWSDLIEYVINTFIKKPHTLQSSKSFRLDTESFDDNKIIKEPENKPDPNENELEAFAKNKSNSIASGDNHSQERWTDDEVSSLTWNYMQCNNMSDTIGEIVKLFKDDGITKSRNSIVRELLKQSIISKAEFDKLNKVESDRNCKAIQLNKEMRDDEIGKLCEQLTLDGKSKYLLWVQAVLLETCFAKICLEKKAISQDTHETQSVIELQATNFDLINNLHDLPVMSSVSYHTIRFDRSVPLVPWNCEQAKICKDLKFLQLLNKLGFHMPVDTGKVFIRIPHFWTPDILYEVSGKIAPIDTSKLKFSLNDISESSVLNSTKENSFVASIDITKSITMATSENFYQIHKQKHLATIVNFTPMPGSSFNSLGDNVTKPNWLEVVQKSQEYKISMGLRSSLMVDGVHENVPETISCAPVTNIVPVAMDIVSSPVVEVLQSPVTLASPSLLMPTIMTVKQDEAQFNPTETEYYNNSVCETASVASDLTRMYVSDEDEKSDVIIGPVQIKPQTEEQISSDSENNIAEKRPRVQFSPTF